MVLFIKEHSSYKLALFHLKGISAIKHQILYLLTSSVSNDLTLYIKHEFQCFIVFASTFISFSCFHTIMKHVVRVFDMTSVSKTGIFALKARVGRP